MKKGRKILVGAMLATTTALAIAGLAGCGHTHTFSDKWTSDETNHWHAATCTDGDECKKAVDGKAAHADANKDGKCDVCDYVMHEHTYATTWSSDASGHWYAATCTYGDACTTAKKDSAAHTDTDGDGVCDTCKFVMSVKLTGTGTTLGMDGTTVQPTAATLNMNLVTNKATLYLTTETVGMNFFLLSSDKSDDPNMAMLYMMAQIIGEGTITTTEAGYKVSFAWKAEVDNPDTGDKTEVPMSLEVVVTKGDSGYSATLTYATITVEIAATK